jgi:hypothetical protein
MTLKSSPFYKLSVEVVAWGSSLALLATVFLGCSPSQAGYVKDGIGKGAEETDGGVKKGVKEGTGGVKKGVKEGTGGVKKGVKETTKLFKKVI